MTNKIQSYFHKKFSLWTGKEAGTHTIIQAQSNMKIEWANLWILLLALIICAVGLNMDSPVIMIGAMLISPLMGPIVAMGVGLSIYDMDMVWSGLRNFLVASLLAIVISGLYFLVTPVQEVTNEILSRTAPNFWDIIIASAGWLVGAIALSRKEKSYTVIPGVAIATTLMPPLAVSSFWFIQGEWIIGMKALYLVFINSVYIIGATFLVARLLRLPKKEYLDIKRKRKVLWLMYGLIIIAAIPALQMTINLIHTQRIEQQFQQFSNSVLKWYPVQILKSSLNTDKKEIYIWLVWKYLSDLEQKTLRTQLPWLYPLLTWYTLILRQGIESDPNLWENVVQPLLEKAIKTQSDVTLELIQQALQNYTLQVFQPQKIIQEAQQLDNAITMIWFSQWTTEMDMTVTIQLNKLITLSKKSMIEDWLRVRIHQPDAHIVWNIQYDE